MFRLSRQPKSPATNTSRRVARHSPVRAPGNVKWSQLALGKGGGNSGTAKKDTLPAFLSAQDQGDRVYQGLSSAFGTQIDNVGVIPSGYAHVETPYEHSGAVHLGKGWRADPDDAEAMEVLGHETAHALAPRGNPDLLNGPAGSAAESGARKAGTGFAAYAAGGFGPRAPRLAAAPSTAGAVNHFESDEHRRSVDWSSELLELAILNSRPERELTAAQIARRDELRLMHLGRNGMSGMFSRLPSDLDPDAVQQLLDTSSPHLGRTIRLANGMEVSPGDITALMGDFYGRLDGESLLVEESMRDINYADAGEMQALLDAFDRERAGEHVGTSDFEGITAGRRDMSYLELAEVNSAHFSSADSSGTDNNMGAYQAFHERALEAAAIGDRNQAYLYESMAMHYLTDRHAGGHSFDKAGIMGAIEGGGDFTGNMRVKSWHDMLNENGAASYNRQGASWTAYGDGSWDRWDNRENRIRTAVSVATSWAELDSVLADPTTLESMRATRGAHTTVPAFSQDRQDLFEQFDRDWGGWSSAQATVWNAGQAPGAVWGKARRVWGQTGNAIDDTLYDLEQGAYKALDWRTWYYGLGGW